MTKSYILYDNLAEKVKNVFLGRGKGGFPDLGQIP